MGQARSVFQCTTVSQLKTKLGKPHQIKRIADSHTLYTWDRFHAYVKNHNDRVIFVREFKQDKSIKN